MNDNKKGLKRLLDEIIEGRVGLFGIAHKDRLKTLAVSSTVSACGEDVSGSGRETGAKPASLKQESSNKAT